jgi:hypothetical protein
VVTEEDPEEMPLDISQASIADRCRIEKDFFENVKKE